MREIVDKDAVEQAVQAAMQASGLQAPDGIYSGPVNIGPLGTSGQPVMEDEPVTLAADPVAPVFDRGDVAGSLAAGLVPTARDIGVIYLPFILGSSTDPEYTFNAVRALEEAGYAMEGAPSTSTISHFEMNARGGGRFIPKTSGLTESESPMSTMVEPEVTPMDSDIDRAVATAVASAMASGGDTLVQAADDPIMTAVETAVGNGQPTMDDTILTEQPTTTLPTETTTLPTETTQVAQPDFMTQLNELIASMQAEQTAAAEQATAAEQQRQEQVAAMTQNYMVGQPAVGYNPYESGQYQNNPYGSAGVPAMGGITTIPVPTAYNPNPYPLGGAT